MGGCISVIYTMLSCLADKVSPGHGNRIHFHDLCNAKGETTRQCSYYLISEFLAANII